MIKNITPGPGITVTGGYNSWPNFYNSPSNGNSLVGQLRYNGNSQNIEVYDGSSWLIVGSSYPNIELSGDTLAVINWAKQKMELEAKIKALAEENPTIKDALNSVIEAKEQLRMLLALVQE